MVISPLIPNLSFTFLSFYFHNSFNISNEFTFSLRCSFFPSFIISNSITLSNSFILSFLHFFPIPSFIRFFVSFLLSFPSQLTHMLFVTSQSYSLSYAPGFIAFFSPPLLFPICLTWSTATFVFSDLSIFLWRERWVKTSEYEEVKPRRTGDVFACFFASLHCSFAHLLTVWLLIGQTKCRSYRAYNVEH